MSYLLKSALPFRERFTRVHRRRAKFRTKLFNPSLLKFGSKLLSLLKKERDQMRILFSRIQTCFSTYFNKANTPDKENVFPEFKYWSNWQWRSYQHLRQNRWLRISYIVNFQWLSGDVPRLPSFRSWLDWLAVVIAFWISILKTLNHFKTIYPGLQISQALESSSGHSPSFCPYLVKYPFKNEFLKDSLIRSSTVVYSTN